MGFVENLDKAASVAICSWLNDGGNAALGAAVVAGVSVPGGQAPALAAGLGVLALNYGCQFNPTTPIPPTVDQGFCKETAGGTVDFEHYGSNGGLRFWSRQNLRIESIGISARPDEPAVKRYLVTGLGPDGSPFSSFSPPVQPGDYYKVTTSNGKCTDYGAPTTPAPLPPITYQGGDAECNISVEFQSWVVGEDGNVRPVMKMSSAGPGTLASGGVISGCNFNPIIYSPGPPGGGGDPPWFAPWAPGPDGPDGAPWWLPLLQGAIAGAVSAIVGKAVEALLDKLFPKELPAVTYRLTGVCEVDAQGEPISRAVERAIPALPYGEGIDARLGAIVDIAQGLKDFKQPVCPPDRPKITGEMVSVNFQSHPNDVPAKNRVYKEFRYRDQNAHPESFHINHWKDFSWETGGAIVTSKGMPWGIVKVWAASVDEGKRVIGHAASAAGVDLTDPKHQWVVSSTADPRYGRRARVYPVKWSETGELMVSKRDGPNGLPAWKRGS